ncbi:uncharacterized protein PGTG_13941 [Puccinia graminis f. sp. tritici CRL 75-36-700-3]|uniref:SUN domain-containing protein n=1 Tax=Puccinia graminis f. sp. tritici (strain CRL 75-36-700-3 / race SCCL) TaxID=418459 RepID=E3KTE5_PUCGT|nr:uncharacterized protein PGTG_13941 [Puccinia graminis f. sp. tritici CRL 75-36-700-3]EFP87570.2 hypothetical protein PGTG_13941 [Puccinia graminis f. sp. tritici CRL 75-36-700-3]
MFSTDTPPQSRRKSFKAFTKQLVNPLQRVQQQDQQLQPSSSMSDRTADNQQQQPQNTNSTQQSQSDRNQQLPPSASLILGQTAKINPRLPRPSASTITLSSVPYSYAYGAAGSPPQPAPKKSYNSAQTVDTTDSISPRSRSSRGRQTALHPDDMSVASVSSEKTGSEPAQIRYARLNQRLQNTGSANAPTQVPPPKVIVPKPNSTHLNDTSVNIASAFERAQLASRLNKNHNPPQKSTQQSANNNHTRPENIQSSYDRQNLNPSNNQDDQYTTSELNQTHQTNKKRKKGRRSIDPSYKYRPGDSATSDSEAGEGIADKRLRREKKARLEQEKLEAQTGTSKKRAISKRRRTTSRRSNGSDDLTDSDLDTGPGIAATRGRRIPKESQPGNASDTSNNVNRRNNGVSRKKGTLNNQRIGDQSDTNDDDIPEGGFIRPKKPTNQNLDTDVTPHARNQHPSATFFLSDPEASQPPEEGERNQSNDQDMTVATTESSRSALRLSGDSYDFAEEERIVKALGDKTRQQRPLAAETSIGDGSTSDYHRQESSSNSGWAGSSRDRIRSDEHARRSDSGMREIEEIIASSRQTAHSRPEKPRVLPLPIPHQKNPISTIVEETHSELRKESDTSLFHSIPESLGTKWGKQFTSLLSHLFRAEFWNRFTWLVLLGSIAFALLINSYKTGDLNIPLLSLFSSSKRTSPTFSAPTTEIQNLAELIERLKSLESVVSTISVEQRQDSKNLQQSLVRDKRELDYKVGKLELKLEEEEKVRGGLEDKVQRKVDQGVKGLRSDLESVIIGHRHDHGQLEKIKQTVEGLGGRIESLDNSNSNSVTREEARVMIEQLWSIKGRDGPGDPEKLKQAVLKATLKQIGQEGYVTKTEIGKLLESELQTMGMGFELQLDSKLEKIRQELQAPRSRTRNLDGSVGGEVLDSVQGMIEEAIERYSQDGIGKRDFALYSGGARVIPQLTSKTYEISVKTWSQKFIGLITGAESVIRGRGPITALSPEVELGKCWPIAGQQGHLAVYLSRKILVTEVSIEHVSKSLAYELDSAPREIEVWSIEDSTKLLDIVYDPNLPSRIQTFKVPAQFNYLSSFENQDDHDVPSSSSSSKNEPPTDSPSVQTPILRQGILFKIKSNHGNPYYTCIYRLRVHGLMESELNLK